MDSLITHFWPGLSEPSLIAGEVVEGFEKSLASALAELRLVVAAAAGGPSCSPSLASASRICVKGLGLL